MMTLPRVLVGAASIAGALFAAREGPAPLASATGTNSAGWVLRAPTGHVTNYDEAKVGRYALPELLTLRNGERVRDRAMWLKRRRPEILEIYEEEIYGRVPPTAPSAHVTVTSIGDSVEGGLGRRKRVVIAFGEARSNGPKMEVVVVVPRAARKPVPLLLQLVFLEGLPSGPGDLSSAPDREEAPNAQKRVETGPVAEILRRGYAYATFRYTDVQPDRRGTSEQGVQVLASGPGQTVPAADEWGTIAVWAWATSRVLDYVETDAEIDSARVALIGHSRLGKTVLWASARDPRFALVFASCSGEMGAALARRDYGETVDDLAANLPWQLARNFQRYAGKWHEMPVDAHMLIALTAPRPVFLTGGTDDQWADPRGQFLAAVAAGEVYRLFGETGLGVDELPPLDEPLITGRIGWLYHTGGHSILAADWRAFLAFADRHLRPPSEAVR